MRRIDVIVIGIVVFAIGGAGYLGLKLAGLDSINAGIWSQLVLVGIILAWSSTYVFRVATKKMTYTQQLKDYEEAVLQKRLEELTPEQLANIQAEIERERKES
jgi:phosphotransferase system  glucose/maltose/N-acetylglucosamine-specific IIC component